MSIEESHSHTYTVSMKNVTLAVDEALLREARRIAAERSTSLNAMIRRFLEELTEPTRDKVRGVELWTEGKQTWHTASDLLWCLAIKRGEGN